LVSFIHCADLHLDKTFSLGSLKVNRQRKQDLIDRFNEVVDYAIKEKPDLFMISGDIFDKINPSNESRIFLVKRLKEIKNKNIEPILIGGNHDVPKDYRNRPMAIDILGSAGIATVFSSRDSFQSKSFEIDNKKVVVIGKSFHQLNERYNPFSQAKISTSGDIHILMLHATYTGSGIQPTIVEQQSYHPFSKDDVLQANINYIALGHYHNKFEEYLPSGTVITNPGSLERFSFKEKKEKKGFIWGEINGDEVSTSFVQVNARKMDEKSIRLEKEYDNLVELIKMKLQKIVDPELILRINLKGEITLNQMNQLNLREVISYFDEQFLFLDFNRTDLSIAEFGKIFVEKMEKPKQAFIKAIDLKISESSTQKERDLYKKVKEKGLDYFEELGG